jgi:hypothetical protein
MTRVGALFTFSIGMLFAFWQKASFICGNGATSLRRSRISLKTLRVFPVSLVLFMRPTKKIFVHFAQMSVIFLSKMQELHKNIKKTFDFFFLI